MAFAPIIVFGYNRPQSLQNCIESLHKNALAKESELFIFVDGARLDKEDEAEKVLATQKIANSVTGFKNITLQFSKENKSIINSITEGVSQVIEKYGKAIVLEDDLILAPNFLDFINQGLERYENERKIFSICGYGLKIKTTANYNSDAYFCTRSSSWGWATWKGRWQSVNWNVNLKNIDMYRKNFNKSCGSDCFRILKRMINWEKNFWDWDILFVFSQFLQNKYSLFPIKSLVINNGFGENSTHTKQKWNRFKSEFDTSGKTEFNFPENIEVNKDIHKQFLHYHSVSMRLLSKVRNFI